MTVPASSGSRWTCRPGPRSSPGRRCTRSSAPSPAARGPCSARPARRAERIRGHSGGFARLPPPMGDRVAIVGVGHAGFAAITAGVSYKELTFEAALRAYDDAGVNPRKDVDQFVSVSEEYVPDQMGAALRPVHTVSADGLFAVATAVMLIRSGAALVVAIEGHSKSSDILTLGS